MADIEIIKGADNGNPPDTLRQMYPKVNRNFQKLNSEIAANKTDADNKLEAHKNSTTAHPAQHIPYTGDIVGVSDVKGALDKTKQTIDDLILGSGDSGPEVAAARGGHPTLGDRLDSSDAQLAETVKHTELEKGIPSPMTYNATPNDGELIKFIHGDDSNPTTDGVMPSVYIQRVDQSVTADDPGHLIPALYTTFKRKTGGKGWLYSGLFYLEDQSDTGTAQSVAVAGMAYAKNKTAVWGVYGDAYKYHTQATITGAEFNSQNHSGTHDFYNDASPVGVPFSCGVWVAPFGGSISSFGLGIGGDGIPNIFDCGIYLKSALNYGVDIQATPQTLIRFKNGAKRASDQTFNGIGLDTGKNANYGNADNTGAIHLWSHRLAFGDADSAGYIQFNSANKRLEFFFGGVRRGYIDLTGTDHAL